MTDEHPEHAERPDHAARPRHTGGPGPADPVARLADEVVDHRFKGLPPDAAGLTVGELAAQRRPLFTGGFTTPVLTLAAGALEHNLRQLGAFATRHGLAFAPHGKTSMSPRLFRRQLDHGAWGITAAVPSQVRVCRAFGVRRVFLANEVVDAAALRWIAAELAADPEAVIVCYVDSVRGVELMDAALAAAPAPARDASPVPRPLDVVVELGVPGGRTGVRTADEAARVARAVTDAASLRLVGVAGYEGEVPDADAARVRAWLEELVALAAALDAAGRFAALGPKEEIVVSAGGSAWFDVVAEVLGRLPKLSRPVLKLLRSGAYVSHDDGHYHRVTPFNRVPGQGSLLPAFRLWAQVISRPEPHLAFLNAGKRDASYDLGLPQPVAVRAAGGAERAADGMEVVKLADQHAFVRLAPGAELEVGDWVALGLSHPCTVFDRWQLIPVAEADGTVTDFVRTFF
ncbi:alanine racemase [Streptomyces pini]|uniref:D-serine deaminase, pyridoxal phosphate-dependent n=1 Tax=Streptomyces pini TaxID=1520580 RepID=A0A1I4L9M1_9ACTN|nr:alanine racemase [Streptomyces pini]SFL87735.1 D-serine deaminase, pyridoxal phosphate-dependent [Streptomyces pini]